MATIATADASFRLSTRRELHLLVAVGWFTQCRCEATPSGGRLQQWLPPVKLAGVHPSRGRDTSRSAVSQRRPSSGLSSHSLWRVRLAMACARRKLHASRGGEGHIAFLLEDVFWPHSVSSNCRWADSAHFVRFGANLERPPKQHRLLADFAGTQARCDSVLQSCTIKLTFDSDD